MTHIKQLFILSTGNTHTHTQLTVVSCVLFRDLTEDYSLGRQPLRQLWGTVPKGKGGAWIYRSFC